MLAFPLEHVRKPQRGRPNGKDLVGEGMARWLQGQEALLVVLHVRGGRSLDGQKRSPRNVSRFVKGCNGRWFRGFMAWLDQDEKIDRRTASRLTKAPVAADAAGSDSLRRNTFLHLRLAMNPYVFTERTVGIARDREEFDQEP